MAEVDGLLLQIPVVVVYFVEFFLLRYKWFCPEPLGNNVKSPR